MKSDETARESWQASVTEAKLPAIEDVRAGADKFYRRLRLRNGIEYVACTVAVAVYGTFIFTFDHPLQKIGSALVILGTLFAAWQLNHRASAVPLEAAGEMSILDFARAQMVRQRDALRSIFWWYILPFLPGIIVVWIGNGQDPEAAARVAIWQRWAAVIVVTALLSVIWWLNQRAARKLQGKIDEIDALKG
jgi:hypothetical protein